MRIEDFRAQLEQDHTWRQEEILKLQNRAEEISLEGDQDQFRRAIILLLYAHFEGFCKFGFEMYVNAINEEKIYCADAEFSIAAAALSDIFRDLRNPTRWSDFFGRAAVDDTKLQRFERDRQFMERIGEIGKR